MVNLFEVCDDYRAMKHTQRILDEYLLLAARTGDTQAANRLATRWQPRLARTARRILRDDDLAEEAVQEAWLSICRGLISLRDPAKFPAWAFGILNRRCMDVLRREIKRRAHSGGEVDEALAALSAPAETRASLDAAFAALESDARTLAILFFGEGLSLKELSDALAIPVGTVKSRLHTIRQHLKSKLEGVSHEL